MDSKGQSEKTLSANVLSELIVVKDHVQDRFRDVCVYCSKVCGESLDVMRDHPVIECCIRTRAIRMTYVY